MRRIPHIGLMMLLAHASLAQFVTLEGRRFMLDGQEFYPFAVNYGIEFVSPPSGYNGPASIYVSPFSQLDASTGSHFECGNEVECLNQLRAHFQKIAEMGFNTIRLVGANPDMYESANGDLSYKLTVHPNQWYATNYYLDLDMDDFSDPLSQRYFALILSVLDAAAAKGLKVILLTGTEVKPLPLAQVQIIYDYGDAENYAAFLHALAVHLRDHPALLAYDVLNEPAWRDYNNNIEHLTKAEVCQWTSLWYDAITSADSNHLVTLGGHSIHEIGAWDPAVMKIDFYSPHVYLDEDLEFAGVYNMDAITGKYMADLYWIAATLEMPWMVGETSFTADDATTDHANDDYLDGLPEHHAMPYMHGSEADQALFAAETMAATRAYKGSGYSWWYFQNGRSTQYNEIVAGGKTYKDLRGNYFGVLGFGDGTLPWRDKLMVGSVQAYQPEPLPDELPEPPPAYGNWHGLPNNVYRTYHLQDQNQEPVANGIAMVQWEYKLESNNQIKGIFWARAVSDHQGELRIRLPLPLELEGYITPGEAAEIMVDAPGAARQQQSEPIWPDEQVLTFNRQILPYAQTLSNLEMVWEAGSRHAAWAELTVQEGMVHASGAENDPVIFEARHWVQATGEFHIGYGSEAQMRTAKTFPACSYPGWGMAPEPVGQPAPLKSRTDRLDASINLRFRPAEHRFKAYPNPCTDVLLVQTSSHGLVEVRDALGRLIASSVLQSENLALDPRQWAPGPYAITFKHNEGMETLRILKVR